MKLLQGAAPEVSHHLESPPAWLHTTHQSFLSGCVCVPHTEGMEQAKGLPKVCPSCLDPPGTAEGIQSRNSHLSKGRTWGAKQELWLRTNFNSSLCRKTPSAYNTNHLHWFWCSPTLIPRFDLVSNTSFPFSCQAERATLSLGPWSCSPPRWVSPLAAGTHSYQSSLSEAIRIKASLTGFRAWSYSIGLFAK